MTEELPQSSTCTRPFTCVYIRMIHRSHGYHKHRERVGEISRGSRGLCVCTKATKTLVSGTFYQKVIATIQTSIAKSRTGVNTKREYPNSKHSKIYRQTTG